MHRMLPIFLVAMLWLSLPDRSYAMIEFLPAFLAIALAGVVIVGALPAAILKIVILKYGVTGGSAPRLLRVVAVAGWETLTMSLSMLVVFSRLEPVAFPAEGQKWCFVAAALALATVLQAFLALFPNHWLIQSGVHGIPAGNDTVHGIGMAVFFSLVTPVITSAIVLGVMHSVSG